MRTRLLTLAAAAALLMGAPAVALAQDDDPTGPDTAACSLAQDRERTQAAAANLAGDAHVAALTVAEDVAAERATADRTATDAEVARDDGLTRIAAAQDEVSDAQEARDALPDGDPRIPAADQREIDAGLELTEADNAQPQLEDTLTAADVDAAAAKGRADLAAAVADDHLNDATAAYDAFLVALSARAAACTAPGDPVDPDPTPLVPVANPGSSGGVAGDGFGQIGSAPAGSVATGA